MQYLQDVQGSGVQELVAFFQEVQECHQHLAMRAKEVLTHCLAQGNGQQFQREGASGMQGSGPADAQNTAGMSPQRQGSQSHTQSHQGTMDSRGQRTQSHSQGHQGQSTQGQERGREQEHDRERRG